MVKRKLPDARVLGVLRASGVFRGLHQRARTIAQSDHYLEPAVTMFPLIGYARSAKIAEVAYRHAVKEIEPWDRPSTPR